MGRNPLLGSHVEPEAPATINPPDAGCTPSSFGMAGDRYEPRPDIRDAMMQVADSEVHRMHSMFQARLHSQMLDGYSPRSRPPTSIAGLLMEIGRRHPSFQLRTRPDGLEASWQHLNHPFGMMLHVEHPWRPVTDDMLGHFLVDIFKTIEMGDHDEEMRTQALRDRVFGDINPLMGPLQHRLIQPISPEQIARSFDTLLKAGLPKPGPKLPPPKPGDF
jgi:hypothetical protein